MKKIFALVIAAMTTLFSANIINAQMLNNEELERFAKNQYGTNWTQAAMRVADVNELNADGSLAMYKTIEAPGMSKEDLYYEMADWLIDNYQNSIQMAEKEDGVIVARPYVNNFATAAFGWNEYKIDFCPTMRIKVTDGRVDIVYTLKDYGVVENTGGGHASTAVACGLLAGAIAVAATTPTTTTTTRVTEVHHHGHHRHVVERRYYQRSRHDLDNLLVACAIADLATGSYDNSHTVWNISNCYPFANKDSHKKASAKALVMATTYMQMMTKNIEGSINQHKLAYNN